MRMNNASERLDILMLKVSNVKKLCEPSTLSEAMTLCQGDRICNVQQTVVDADTTKIQGMVLGNFNYYHEVHLTLNRHKNNMVAGYSCDCYEQSVLKTPCRHCIALALHQAEEDGAEETAEAAVAMAAPEIDAAAAEPVAAAEPSGMEIMFGHRLDAEATDGEAVPFCWTPNDTTRVFHSNTGIIGTMGTGKTQFTKSLVTQLYRQQEHNYDGTPLGILIFDDKGDYNDTHPEFQRATKARVLKPDNLPFNPLALVKSRVFKPKLPVHTANAFKDTLSRVFRLGPGPTGISCKECKGIGSDVQGGFYHGNIAGRI